MRQIEDEEIQEIQESEEIEDEEDDEEELLRQLLEGNSGNESESEVPPSEEIPENEDIAKIQIWKWFFSLEFVLKVVIVLCLLFGLFPIALKMLFTMFDFLLGGGSQLGSFFD